MVVDRHTLADFELERAACEVRFATALMHWDRAGTVWTEMHRQQPDLALVVADPAKVHFRLGRSIELVSELDKLHVTVYAPRTGLDDLADVAATFFDVALAQLQVSELTRVGLRLFYFHRCQDMAAATEAFLATGCAAVPPSPHFVVDGKPTVLQYSARIEGEEKGVTVRISVEHRRMEFEPPPGISWLQPTQDESFGLLYDVDLFTRAPIGIEQLDLREWINQGRHVVRRDSGAFLAQGG